jgi:hypothetical protein
MGGPVLAHAVSGPSGSTWSGGQVTCGHKETIIDSPIVVYNGFRGAEVCSEAVGRVWVQSNRGNPIALPDYIHNDWDDDFVLTGQGHIDLPF